jgi:hypothetical protein
VWRLRRRLHAPRQTTAGVCRQELAHLLGNFTLSDSLRSARDRLIPADRATTTLVLLPLDRATQAPRAVAKAQRDRARGRALVQVGTRECWDEAATCIKQLFKNNYRIY